MSRKLIPIAALILALSSGSSFAQISTGGEPVSFTKAARGTIQEITMSAVDVPAYLAEDQLEMSKDVPFRFGAPIDVNYDLKNSGTWETLADGSRLWRLQITSKGAYSLNLLYDDFWLPEGGRLFLYSPDKSHIIGAFTAANNKEHGEFSTAPTKGDEVILEYNQPAGVTDEAIIKISRVVHAYRNIFDFATVKDAAGFGDAGSCNNNAACAVGDDWRDQIRSAAMILTSGGFRICSGSMVNNVREDGIPYFLTANHCLGGETTWIFMWNYESPTCSNTDGPTWMTVQGSTLKATFSTSDFALLQLNETPPDSYNVYWAGWSAEDIAGDSSVGIHHPQGDIKKISFDYDNTALTNYLGNTPGPTHIRVIAWDDGTTEPGSSGSPLFNKNKQVIGQLHGGYASCTSITSDWYGKLARSWLGGGGSSNSLKPWLDPDNTGLLTLDGWDPNTALVIEHNPFGNTSDTLNDYEIVALIESDTTLVSDALLLHYTISAVPYFDTLESTINPDEYHGYIPAQSPGTNIEYFLTAENVLGDVDTSDVYAFQVLGYSVALNPAGDTATGAVDDTVLYSLAVTNNGAISDEYNLSLSGYIWSTELLDATGTFPVSSSGALTSGQYFDFTVRVIIPASVFGQSDQVTVTAQSVADVGTLINASITTISAGQPVAIPFIDEFPGTTLDPAKWVLNIGAAINALGLNEPTEPYSINLNADPNGADTIMSQAISLSGQDSIVLSYYYQRGGGGESPDAGDDLFVEYYNSSGQWIVLDQLLGSGPDMGFFQHVSHLLGLDAYHSAFRIRVRNIGTVGLFDDWFVDDFRVDGAPVSNITPSVMNASLPQYDSSEQEIIVYNAGQGQLIWDASIVYLTKKNALFEQLQFMNDVEPASRKYSDGFFVYEDAKGTDDPRAGFPVEKDAGGPDVFGYVWVDSDEAGGPSFNWVDVSGSGTDVIADFDDDNYGGPYDLGFNFPFYGNSFSQIYIGSNGIIGFSPTDMASRFKVSIPTSSTPNNILAWMWDDLDPTDADNLNAHVYIDTSSGQCVIQFVDYAEYSAAAGDVITAEVILYPNGDIVYQYLEVAPGFDVAGSAIGIENANGTDGLEVAFLTSYAKDSLAVRFSIPFQWLTIDKGSGSLLSGESDTITAKFQSGDLADSAYLANLIITSNDPNGTRNPWVIPTQLSVSSGPPYVCGDFDGNGQLQNAIDLVYIVNYIFRGGAAIPDVRAADVDGNGTFQTTLDMSYFVNYMFRAGPALMCP